ncbi:MAG: hypothetical protein AAGC74_03455 [Verrucomicrobiota bacterium]
MKVGGIEGRNLAFWGGGGLGDCQEGVAPVGETGVMDAMHPYEALPLSTVGLVVGVYLVLAHGLMLAKGEFCRGWLKRLPRHGNAGVWAMGIALLWFWLLVAPDIRGSFSWLGALSMDLGEFNGLKPTLRIAVPLAYVGVVILVKEFLFVRGLGVIAMLAAAPMLDAAFLKEPGSRVFLSLFAYILLTKGMFWVGMPFTFRDAVTWATQTEMRWKVLAGVGLVYGVVVLGLSLTVWRGH